MATSEKIFKGIKISLKALGTLIIVGVYVILFVRMCSVGGIPEGFEDLTITDKMIELYNEENGDEHFIYQSINKFNANEDSYGFFSVSKYVIIDGADEIQLIFKFNKSTLENVAEEYELAEPIDREAKDTFELSLVVKNAVGAIQYPDTDEHGETLEGVDYNSDENLDKTYTLDRLYPTDMEFLVDGRYNYIKCTFKNVDFDKNVTLGLFLDINYKDDIRYTKPDPEDGEKYLESYGRICIYNYTSPDRVYKFTSNDKQALKGAD